MSLGDISYDKVFAQELLSHSVDPNIRTSGQYSITYDGDEVITCYDDQHPEGISVYGWLNGLAESLGVNADPYHTQEVAEYLEYDLFYNCLRRVKNG